MFILLNCYIAVGPVDIDVEYEEIIHFFGELSACNLVTLSIESSQLALYN